MNRNDEQAKIISNYLTDFLLNFEDNITFSKNICKLYLDYQEFIDFNTENPTKEVLYMFYYNMFNGLKSILVMIDNNCYENLFVISRRIIEIFIRNEYLRKNDYYANYYNEKYLEQASILRNTIKGNSLKYITKNPIWLDRDNIVNKNKELFNKIHVEKSIKPIPNIENMANETGLTYLYKTSYSSWSKIVHCNMSSEGFIRYKINENLSYNYDDTLFKIRQNDVRQMIACVNQCMYQFIKSFCDYLQLNKSILLNFNENNSTFVSFDLYTGLNSNVSDIVNNYANNVVGSENINLVNNNESLDIFYTNPSIFKYNNESLENLILETEEKIRLLPNG